jgi:hypothetical protein
MQTTGLMSGLKLKLRPPKKKQTQEKSRRTPANKRQAEKSADSPCATRIASRGGAC